MSKVVSVLHSNPSCVANIDANASLSIFGEKEVLSLPILLPPLPSLLCNSISPFCRRQFDIPELMSYKGMHA